MQQKIYITLHLDKEGKNLVEYQYTDASSTTDSENIALFEQFIEMFKITIKNEKNEKTN